MRYKVELIAGLDLRTSGCNTGSIVQMEYTEDWKKAINEFYATTSNEDLNIIKEEYEVDILHLAVSSISKKLIHLEVVVDIPNKTFYKISDDNI